MGYSAAGLQVPVLLRTLLYTHTARHHSIKHTLQTHTAQLASFPGLSHLQYLIAYSMHATPETVRHEMGITTVGHHPLCVNHLFT